MPLINYVPTIQAFRYDGTNSAELLSLCPELHFGMFGPGAWNAEIVSEVDGVLTIHYDMASAGPLDLIFNTGDFLVVPFGHGPSEEPQPNSAATMAAYVPLDTLTNP